jgi:potassium-transporting ATPase KdpC subunit
MGTTWNNTLKEFRPLIVITVALLLVTTVVYPLVVTGVGQLFFNRQANGSVITLNGVDVGSSLIGQTFTGDHYFQGRPSAAGAGYDASASSGSNLGPTSDKLINGVTDDPSTADVNESFAGIVQRVAAFRDSNGVAADQKLPSDSVTASASGLDPHVSPATARLQVDRVATARGASADDVRKLVDEYTEGRAFGFIGEPRVNVLKLNIALDQRLPMPAK